FSRLGAMNVRREKEIAADYTRRLSIKTPAIFAPAATLSGGNQQKVALSRWLVTKPSVLILDEPTQGIDVGAKSEIHALMTELAGQGVAILMISSELPEILGMSDRIAVMFGGTMVATLDRSEATQQRILALALGHLEAAEESTSKGSRSLRDLFAPVREEIRSSGTTDEELLEQIEAAVKEVRERDRTSSQNRER